MSFINRNSSNNVAEVTDGILKHDSIAHHEEFKALLERIKRIEAFFPTGVINSSVSSGVQAAFFRKMINEAISNLEDKT